MSTSSIARVPHVHAEAIKQWADGIDVQYRSFISNGEWCDLEDGAQPNFFGPAEWRVKPEKVYPVTQMTSDEMMSVWCTPNPNSTDAACVSLANAALRHAIDANQIITMADHMDALDALGQNMKGVEITRHADRDMAIAEAVRDACYAISTGYGSTKAAPDIREMNIATIIAKVRP